jgi:hypothetical protein
MGREKGGKEKWKERKGEGMGSRRVRDEGYRTGRREGWDKEEGEGEGEGRRDAPPPGFLQHTPSLNYLEISPIRALSTFCLIAQFTCRICKNVLR